MYSFEILKDIIHVHWRIWQSKKHLGRKGIDTLQFHGIAVFFFVFLSIKFNLLTPNVNYSGRTATLTSKVAFCIFIQQI